MRIDAHQHFWSLARGDYRWLTPDLRELHRDFGPADLAPLLSEAGIERTVLVQAADTTAETRFLLGIARETPFVAGVVGWVDLEAPEFPEDARLVGVRPMIQDLPDDRWMLRPALEPALRELVRRDLAFDALVKPRHLSHLRALVERHPDLRVVIDHGGKPSIPLRDRAWSEDLRSLAGAPNVWCKLSGLVTEAAGGWGLPDLRPCVDALLESFGPARLVWGSDWPVVETAGGFRRWWRATEELLRGLSPTERDAILGGNAARVYRLRGAPA